MPSVREPQVALDAGATKNRAWWLYPDPVRWQRAKLRTPTTAERGSLKIIRRAAMDEQDGVSMLVRSAVEQHVYGDEA